MTPSSSFAGWLDANPWAYWAGAGGATLLVVLGVILVAPLGEKAPAGPSARTAALRRLAHRSLPWLLLLMLLAWRWPVLVVPGELNVDESQQIAGALTLARDPVFWRSVDGTTSGPLNVYVLVPIQLLGLPLNYVTARLAGLLLVWAMLLGCRRVAANWMPDGAAWVGVVPVAVFLAAVSDADFVHHTSEHLSLALLALSLAAVTTIGWRPAPGRRDTVWSFLGGFAAGALPWAKLQAGPLLLVPAAVAAAAWWRRRDERPAAVAAAAFGAGLVAPTAVCVILVAAAGQLHNAWQSYFVNAFNYVAMEVPELLLAREFWRLTSLSGLFPALLKITGAWLALGLITGLWRRDRPRRALWVLGLGLLLVTLFVVRTPQRAFPHYLLFLLPPLILLAAGAAARLLGQGSALARMILAALLVVPSAGLFWSIRRQLPTPGTIGHLAQLEGLPATPLGRALGALAREGDRLTVWGWNPQAHVETGLPQGTRDAHSYGQIEPGPLQHYYRARYLADLRRNRPRLFVDAVQPAAFGFTDAARHSHETFPELAALIAREYRLHAEVDGARVYVRFEPEPSPAG